MIAGSLKHPDGPFVPAIRRLFLLEPSRVVLLRIAYDPTVFIRKVECEAILVVKRHYHVCRSWDLALGYFQRFAARSNSPSPVCGF
jgi:hypothetical protein